MGHSLSVAHVEATRDTILLRLQQILNPPARRSILVSTVAVFERFDPEKCGWIASTRLHEALHDLGLDNKWPPLAVDAIAHGFSITKDPETDPTTSIRLDYPAFIRFLFFPLTESTNTPHLTIHQRALATLSAYRLMIHAAEFNGENVTIKELGIASAQEPVDRLRRCVNHLQLVSHPNLVRYRGTVQAKRALYIVEVAHPSCTLKTVLESFGGMKESTVRRYAVQMLQALEFLHDHDVVHGNLHLESIHIDTYGVVKLSEFGIAHEIASVAQATTRCEGDWTAVYAPPEWKDGNQHSNKAADVWSVGVIILQMLQGIGSAPSTKDKHAPPLIPATVSKSLRQVLQACFQRQPQKRACATDLLAMEFCHINSAQATNDMLRDVCSDLDASMRRLTALGSTDTKAAARVSRGKHTGRQTVPAIKTPLSTPMSKSLTSRAKQL